MVLQNTRFDRRIQRIAPLILSSIAQIDELKGQWISGARLSPQTLGRLKRAVLLTSTGASTRIEGAKLSDEEIEKLLRGLRVEKFADRDSQEVRGYYELLNNVFDSWKKIRFSESSVKHFHKELLKHVEKDVRHRGEYKKMENSVNMVDTNGNVVGVIFKTTPAYLTPKEMREIMEWTTKALTEKHYHPLLVIANFLVEFLAIHPFLDGNGRLSRILTNLLLLQAGYAYVPYVSHEKLVETNKSDYYLALRQSQKTFKTNQENIAPWLTFFLNIFSVQSKRAVDLLSKENVEKILSHKQLAVWQYLQTVAEASPREIAEHSRVARPTVNQALDKLLRLKKIERLGEGRSTRYRKI